jgi:hypothetical protein
VVMVVVCDWQDWLWAPPAQVSWLTVDWVGNLGGALLGNVDGRSLI